VLRAQVDYSGSLELRGYFPWDWTGAWTAAPGLLEAVSADGGAAAAVATEPGTTTAVMDACGEAVARFEVEPGATLRLAFALAPSPALASVAAREALTADAVDVVLEAGALAYERTRVAVDGAWEGLAASVTQNLHWMVLLQPETGRRYAPAGRRWIFPHPEGGRDHWTLFEWDAFFGALELAIESPELAWETAEAVLATQYPNGNVPNWRSRHAGTPDRSQPPVGAFAVLKLYLRTGDRERLARAFPALERWSAWWREERGGRPRRDGNASGLFEWGSHSEELAEWRPEWERTATGRQRAAWESGQDDLPAWDAAGWDEAAGTLDLESVDLNALLTLDHECLAAIADVLGAAESATLHRARAEALKARMNEWLWDEGSGLYLDRFWDGRRSPRLVASHFYPLLAGVPDQARAERMLATLTDPARFWGRFVLPTVSRDDPAFADQQYWRGTIWPPTNYLVGQGLRRYGFEDAASALAVRSVDLFLAGFRELQLCRENYDSRTGEGGGQRHQSWGPLFALLGIEEFADVTPWDGLRVGSLAPPPRSCLRRLPLLGRLWTITLGPQGLVLEADGRELLRSDRPVVLKRVQLGARELTAEAVSHHGVALASAAAVQRLGPGTHAVRLPLA
jgi:neutral trehalase